MKFYLTDRDGNTKKITKKVALTYLSKDQIESGIEEKKADPYTEVSYMCSDGFVSIEF